MFLFVMNLQDWIQRKKGEMQRKDILEGRKQRKRVKGSKETIF